MTRRADLDLGLGLALDLVRAVTAQDVEGAAGRGGAPPDAAATGGPRARGAEVGHGADQHLDPDLVPGIITLDIMGGIHPRPLIGGI